MEKIESKIGSKGELFIPIKIRKKFGLVPGKSINFFIDENKIVVEVIPDLKSLLIPEKMKVKTTLKEIKENRINLSLDAEN